MAKRKNKHGNGANDAPYIARGRGGGGSGGRGGFVRGRGRGGHPTSPGSSFMPEELDFTIHMYADSPNPAAAQASTSGYSTPRGGGRGWGRGRGRGRGWRGRGFVPQQNGSDLGGWSDHGSGRGRGRGDPAPSAYLPRHGRGLGASAESTPAKLGRNSTLSDLLYVSRPLLRPIRFTSPVNGRYLFQKEEEMLESAVEEVGGNEASRVPTASQVERIFHGTVNSFGDSSSSSSSAENDDEEEIEEIDFNDLNKLIAPPQDGGPSTTRKVNVNSVLQLLEGQTNPGFYKKKDGAQGRKTHVESGRISAQPEEAMEVSVERNLSAPQPMDVESSPLFIIDTQPGPVPSTLPHQTPKHEAPSDDEEVIVYIAPHPKQRRSPPSTTTTITTRNDTPIGQAPDAGDTSAFEPYIPPSTLALASISIQGEASAAPIPELHPTQDEQPSKTETVSLPETASTPAPTPTTPLPHPTVESLKLGLISALNQEVSRTSIPGTRKLPSAMSPRMTKQQKAWERKKAKREREGKKRKGRRGSSGHFAAYGALVSEARLEDVWVEGRGKGEDPRWEERRRGDSDLEWGTEDEGEREDGGEEEVEEGALVVGKSEKAKGKQRARDVEGVEEDHGMEVDEIDVSAMKQFVSSLVGETAGEYVTMDDIEAEKQIRAEDEEGLGGAEGSSDEDEVEGVLKLEEKLFIGESDDEESEEDEEDEEDDSEDDEAFVSPKSSFQARLEKLRKKSREKRPANGSDEEDDDMLARNLAWDEEDDEYDEDISLIDHVQGMLAKGLIQARNKEGNKVFNAIQDGDFDPDYADMQPARKRKDKYKDIPKELQETWERDRQKKAEHKRERELLKLIEATDPIIKKKGGKKGRKAMMAASRLDPTINVIPNRIIDLATLVQQIWRFIRELDGPQSMVLPPADKETRKNVHELAQAFGLKSVSKGKGAARYTTLIKTSMSVEGMVDEKKVGRIVRRGGGAGARGENFGEFKERRGGGFGRGVPKHQEGEEVGAAAPKIGASNVGFQMLAAMGWSEGGKIGLSGGLDAPLVARIKHSKLGLGATK